MQATGDLLAADYTLQDEVVGLHTSERQELMYY